MIYPWDPKSFNSEIVSALDNNSELISDYFREDIKLMDEHLSSSTYQSLKSNRFNYAFSDFKENVLTPILKHNRIIVWHYTRLTDDEVEMMRKRLMPSTLDYLKLRLELLVSKGLLTYEESQVVFKQSPFHKQERNRSGMLWTTTTPDPITDMGVEPLLQSWGGESAHFWLTDEDLKLKLKEIGLPRVIEIETEITDGLNAFSVSETFLEAWAKKLGINVAPSGTDLSIKSSVNKAKVVKVHTEGQSSFNELAKTYPKNVQALLRK
ncbi:hypothetical protein [Shewanella japonica]|uniref:hypothetical protein n=1 Tax=Shewanella japonica TaxID=93973 RepID=UPI0024945D0A|nr:hypothetical protein [Shewanella japonica]